MRAASGELLAFSDANAIWEPDALGRLVAAFGDPAVGYACGRVQFVNDAGTNQEGAVLALGHVAARARVRARLDHGRQRGDLRRAPARPTSRSTRSWATTSRCRSTSSRRAGARSTAGGARAMEKMVPTVEGEWARKRRMMSHAWPIVAARRAARPARLPAAVRGDVASHRVPALRHAAPARVAAAPRSRGSARGRAYARGARPGGRARRGAGRRPVPGAPAAGRPLLRAHDGLARRRAVRLAAPRHAAGWEAAEGTR